MFHTLPFPRQAQAPRAWGVRPQHLSVSLWGHSNSSHFQRYLWWEAAAQRNEISVIMAIGLDCSLTPRSPGGQSSTGEGMLASEPPGPPGTLTPPVGLPMECCDSPYQPLAGLPCFSPQEGTEPSTGIPESSSTSLRGPHSSLPMQPVSSSHKRLFQKLVT